MTSTTGDNSHNSTKIAVGSRVETSDSPSKTGVVVEDFGDLADAHVTIERGRVASSRRWAVMLDDGTLVFLNDGSLRAIE